MNSEIVEAFSQIAREKNVEKDTLREILESIFLLMIKKKYGTSDNFQVIVNIDKGDIEIYRTKTVVETVNDANLEIDLETARKTESGLEVGDEFIEIISPESFGRRLIVTAKQNLNQRIRDFERELILSEYKNRIGEIIIGDIHQITRDEIYINIDKTEVTMPKKEQIPSERYHRGMTVRAVIKEVLNSPKGPQICVSRADPMFLTRLFELEVPEIYDGVIEIKAIAREPGERAKVAVDSSDKRVDAVGACVGMKGVRIQAIVKELNNERIDIVNWTSEPALLIARSLTPSKPTNVILDRETKTAIAVIPDDQISLAIGKGGQNIRLASHLTHYKIETMRDSEWRARREEAIAEAQPPAPTPESVEEKADLLKVEGIGEATAQKLIDAGFKTIEEVRKATVEQLTEIQGIGEKTAQKILDAVNEIKSEQVNA